MFGHMFFVCVSVYMCWWWCHFFSTYFFPIIFALDLFLLLLCLSTVAIPYCSTIKLCAKSITQASLATIEWVNGIMIIIITSFNMRYAHHYLFFVFFGYHFSICAYCFVILLQKQIISLNLKSPMKNCWYKSCLSFILKKTFILFDWQLEFQWSMNHA